LTDVFLVAQSMIIRRVLGSGRRCGTVRLHLSVLGTCYSDHDLTGASVFGSVSSALFDLTWPLLRLLEGRRCDKTVFALSVSLLKAVTASSHRSAILRRVDFSNSFADGCCNSACVMY